MCSCTSTISNCGLNLSGKSACDFLLFRLPTINCGTIWIWTGNLRNYITGDLWKLCYIPRKLMTHHKYFQNFQKKALRCLRIKLTVRLQCAWVTPTGAIDVMQSNKADWFTGLQPALKYKIIIILHAHQHRWLRLNEPDSLDLFYWTSLYRIYYITVKDQWKLSHNCSATAFFINLCLVRNHSCCGPLNLIKTLYEIYI